MKAKRRSDTVSNFITLRRRRSAPLVIATAEVTAVEKNMVTFAIEARDHVDVVSRGTHVRAVIDMERFLKRIKAKIVNIVRCRKPFPEFRSAWLVHSAKGFASYMLS